MRSFQLYTNSEILLNWKWQLVLQFITISQCNLLLTTEREKVWKWYRFLVWQHCGEGLALERPIWASGNIMMWVKITTLWSKVLTEKQHSISHHSDLHLLWTLWLCHLNVCYYCRNIYSIISPKASHYPTHTSPNSLMVLSAQMRTQGWSTTVDDSLHICHTGFNHE